MVASWYVMLTPWERALDQLTLIFASGYESRDFFVWLVIANVVTLVVAVTFWFKSAASYPLALILVGATAGLLAWSILWSDSTFIFIYLLGCLLSIWSWRQPNPAFKRDSPRSGRAP
jgi:hypothetical protein